MKGLILAGGAGTRLRPITHTSAKQLVPVESSLQRSVVLERSRIVGVSGIADSLIGHDVEVTRSARDPRALRLMLGDHSLVDLE